MDALCFSVSMDCCQGTFKGHTAKERNKRCSFRLRAVTGTEHKTDISNHFCTWTTSFIIFIVGLGMSGINCQQPSASPSSRKQAEWQFCAIAGLGPFLIQPSWNIWQLKKTLNKSIVLQTCMPVHRLQNGLKHVKPFKHIQSPENSWRSPDSACQDTSTCVMAVRLRSSGFAKPKALKMKSADLGVEDEDWYLVYILVLYIL